MTREEIKNTKGLGLAKGESGKEYLLIDPDVYTYDEARKIATDYIGNRQWIMTNGTIEDGEKPRKVYVVRGYDE